MTTFSGQCLCGAVQFHGSGAGGVTPCHCGQCRRWAGGGPFMPTHFESGVIMEADETLVWYRSSDEGERGFCNVCGTSLFWRTPGAGSQMAVNVSTLGDNHGLKISAHVWAEDQPGWYAFADNAPRMTAEDFRENSAEVIHD